MKQFTSNIDIALDQVDRDRLAVRRRKKKNQGAAPAGQSPAIFASSSSAVPEQASSANLTAGPAIAPGSMRVSLPTSAEPSSPSPPLLPVAAAATAGPVVPASPGDPAGGKHLSSANERLPVLASANTNLPPMASPDKAPMVAKSAPMDSPALVSPVTMPPASSPAAMGAMTAATPPAAAPVPEKVETPMTPVIASAPTSGERTMEDALDVVRKGVAAHPTLNTALALALLDTGDGKAADVAKSLSPADQKVLADLLAALQGMNDTAASTPAGAAESLADRGAPLVNAAKKMRRQADADLHCRGWLWPAGWIHSASIRRSIRCFEQGKKHTVIIYCEVANFSSKKTKDDWYQTSLSQQETLVTEDGLLIWRPNAEEVEDRSMNQRHDFYLVKKLTIPENLAAGKYTLRMSVTDRNNGKIAMVSLPVEIK